MATYLLWSGGNGTSGTAAGGWAAAYQTLTAALAGATSAGDVIKVHKTHQENVSAATTYTAQNHISLICVDKDASDALATMGTGGWIGHDTTSQTITFAGAFNVYFYGVTLRLAGASGRFISIANTDLSHYKLESCYLWMGTTASGSGLTVAGADRQAFAEFENCIFRWGTVSSTQNISSSGHCVINGGSISADGSIPSVIFGNSVADPSGAIYDISGFDMSHAGSGTLFGRFC